MARISFDEIQEELDMEFFLERESIAYRVGHGVSGEQLNIKECPNPACGDTRWRTYFGTDTGRGNCFKCGKGFTKTSFIRDYYNTDWKGAYPLLVEILEEQGYRPKRQMVAAVEHGDVELPYSVELPTPAGENLTYLRQRGFDDDITRYFHLRYCEFGWWKYVDPEGETKTQNFENRVIIPVYDLDGTLRTFQGRDLTGASDKKYLFPVGLPGTGRYLFNGQNVFATDHVVMGEGAFDVAAIKIALEEDQALRDVVAIGSFGKHLSYGSTVGDDQLGRFIQLKARGLKIVTIMWDGEEAALLAALNAAKLLAGLGLTVRIALLPFEKDPNEVLPEVVRAAFYKAETWSPALDIKYRLRNPYSERSRRAS